MSGKVLIADELATNRIAMKAKLADSHYEVLQAATGKAAVAAARQQAPDLILASARLADLPGPRLLRALHRQAGAGGPPPVILIQPDADLDERLAALEAGADDVLTRPWRDGLLLARLRNLLRQRHADQDLDIHSCTAQALGFADAQRGFGLPGRIALVASSTACALALRARMAPGQGHDFVALAARNAVNLDPATAMPDVYVLQIAPGGAEEGLRLIAELQAARRSRHCPIMAVLDQQSVALAATLLDMGCSAVLLGLPDPREMQLRLDGLLARKRRCDRLRDQLQSGLEAAVIDPLTGAYNRRYALPFLSRLIADAGRHGRGFAVMLADLDHFKLVNDQHGHAAGDRVLRQVAKLLRSGVRDEDLIARIGGEEFLIVLPETGRNSAQHTAGRLRHAVQHTPIRLPGQSDPVQVTVSIGVALAEPRPDSALPSIEELLDQADRALYCAKHGGRNTVTFAARPAA